MLRSSRIVGSLALVALFYGLFLVAWPVVETGFVSLYSGCANAAFGSMVPDAHVRFQPELPPKGIIDTHIHVTNLRTGARRITGMSSRHPAYLQIALFVSLVLATPMPWRRKPWALLGGLVLVALAIACKQAIVLLYSFAWPSVGILTPQAPWDVLLNVAGHLAYTDLVIVLVIPLFIWFLVCFRASDWQRWIGPAACSVSGGDRAARSAPNRAGSRRNRKRGAARKRTAKPARTV